MGNHTHDTIVVRLLSGVDYDEIVPGLCLGRCPDGSPYWSVTQVKAAFEDLRLKRDGVRSDTWRFWTSFPTNYVDHHKLLEERRRRRQYLDQEFEKVLRHIKVTESLRVINDIRSRRPMTDDEKPGIE